MTRCTKVEVVYDVLVVVWRKGPSQRLCIYTEFFGLAAAGNIFNLVRNAVIRESRRPSRDVVALFLKAPVPENGSCS